MAAISAFRALRYNPAQITDLSAVIAPPYDVITAEEQARLYGASPYNVVRLTFGKQSTSDTPGDNRYTRAQRDFKAWCAQGILQNDPAPALYLIEHSFTDQGSTRSRLGFIALLQLDDSTPKQVYRHEATLAAPKEDRTRLLETVPANLDPIFCVYPDEQGTVQALLHDVTQRAAPVAQAILHGDAVRLWALIDQKTIQTVTRHLTSVAVLIADGHHRFEVALANRRRYGSLMSYFVSMGDPSLVVRPIHRILLQGARVSGESLRSLCTMDSAADLDAVTKWLDQQRDQGHFGYSDGKAWHCVSVQADRLARWLMSPSMPLPVAALDVSVLHGLLLPSLGITGTDVRYTGDVRELLDALRTGQGCCTFLLRGIPLPQVYALAAQGLTLPPKSTFFYPKVPSGFTINPLA